MTITIAGYLKVHPDERKQILLDMRPFIDASRLEPGCVAYQWSADLSEPEVIYVFEEWTDGTSLKNHFQRDPYQDTLKMIGRIKILGSSFNKYRVDLVEPVYDQTGTPRADFFTAD